jgi:hypothetical protein
MTATSIELKYGTTGIYHLRTPEKPRQKANESHVSDGDHRDHADQLELGDG